MQPQPCPTCGRMEVDAAGYCQGCSTFRGAPTYEQGGQYGFQASAPPYSGPPASGAPYGGPQASGPPYSGQPASGAPYGQPASGAPYGGQQYDPYQGQQQYAAGGGYTDPNYQQGFAPAPARSRRPSTVPLIVLSVVAVILVVGIVAVVVLLPVGPIFSFCGFLLMVACALVFVDSARKAGKIGLQSLNEVVKERRENLDEARQRMRNRRKRDDE